MHPCHVARLAEKNRREVHDAHLARQRHLFKRAGKAARRRERGPARPDADAAENRTLYKKGYHPAPLPKREPTSWMKRTWTNALNFRFRGETVVNQAPNSPGKR